MTDLLALALLSAFLFWLAYRQRPPDKIMPLRRDWRPRVEDP